MRGRFPRAAAFSLLVSVFATLALPPLSRARSDAPATMPLFFYKHATAGSDAQFNPISSFVNYSLDSHQVSENFGSDNLGAQLDQTLDALLDPAGAIDKEGGLADFVNRQVFPIRPDKLGDSVEMIPNYGLHLLGGGLVYRKNTEWFYTHGYRYPRTYAAVLGMVAEFLQEVIEKESTPDDDPVADFYIFRPVGMLLFTWDPFARFCAETLRLVEWPYQPMFDLRDGKIANVGQSYAARPRSFPSKNHTLFVYFGITNLLGLSHRLNASDSLSWGAGGAVVNANRDDVRIRASGGLFYDRNDSLFASIIFNGSDDLAVRCNVHPGVVFAGSWSPGVFIGIGDEGDVSLGLTIRFTPVGLGATL